MSEPRLMNAGRPPISTVEVFVPTVMLGFIEKGGRQMLHQLYVSALGNTEWRKVPMMTDQGKMRHEAVVGAVEEEQE